MYFGSTSNKHSPGPMVWAPLSEVPQIGRVPTYILTLAAFIVLQVPAALATNHGTLMGFRFITGFFGSDRRDGGRDHR